MSGRNFSRGNRADATLVLAFVFACLWCANAFFNANMVARVALAHAMASRHVLNIDEVAIGTIDKAEWQGHYYCDKAPGVSLFCVPGVFLADRFADALGEPPAILLPGFKIPLRYYLDSYACLFSTTILASAALLVAFRRTLTAMDTCPKRSSLMALALGFGTPLFTWSTAVFGHATAAALLFLAFATAWWRGPDGPARWLAAGALLGAAVLVEFTALLAGSIIVGFLLLRAPVVPTVALRRTGLILIGGLPFALTLGWYNWAAFGSPFHLGYMSTAGWEGMKQGFFGISAPSVNALWGITFSQYRGLVWLSPACVLGFVAVLGLALTGRQRAVGRTLALIALVYLLLNAGYFYWDGGASLGPRHLTPAIPFLFAGLTLWMERLPRGERVAVGAVVIIGVVIETTATVLAFYPRPDGSAMLMVHILPRLLGGTSELMLARAGLPFALLLAVPFAIVAGAAVLLLRLQEDATPVTRQTDPISA